MSKSTAVLQPAPLSVEALNQQIRSTVVRALYHRFNDTQRQILVRGIIGDISATDYRVCYKVPLKDGGQTVYLDVPRQLLASRNIETGDYIQVTGILSVDGGQTQSSRVDIRIAVSDAQRVDQPSEFERQDRATLDYLRQFRPARSPFPAIGSIRISVLHPISAPARVQDDFQRELAAVAHLCEVELIPVAMNQADALTKGIQQATGNVLVLIRGSASDDSDFDVFDQKPVIEEWADKNAFKTLGLGHEGTGGTLLDFISDYVGSTPTAVGGFLAQRIAEMGREREQRIQMQTLRAQMEE